MSASALGALSIGVVILLAVTVDEGFGWLLIPALPVALVLDAAGTLRGVAGLVFAVRDRGRYAWPVAGLLLGVGQLTAVGMFISGAFS